MNYKIITLILALLLSVLFSYGQEDFIASAPLNLNVFQCSDQDFDLLIQNTGDTTINFLVDQEGKAVQWNFFNQNILALSPGEYTIIKNSLQIPCEAYGTYYLTTIISTDNQEKYLEQEINVLKPENIQFKSGNLEQTIEACKTAKFSFELFNSANFTETYLLSTDKKIKDTKLSDEKLVLKGLENKNISVQVDPIDCELSGEFILPLNIKTEKTNLEGVLDLKLTILPAKITKLEGPERITINYEESKHQVKITNKLNKTEKYTLKLEGPNWFKLDNSSLSINKDETKTFNIIANPQTTIAQGNYNVKLLIKDEASKEITKNFVFTLKKPISKQTIYRYVGFGAGTLLLLLIIILILYQSFSKSAREKRKKLRLSKEKIKKELEKELKLQYKLVPRDELRSKRTKKFFKVLGVLFLFALFISIAVLSFYFREYRLLKIYYAWAFLSGASLFLFLLTLLISLFTVFRSEEKKQQIKHEKELREKEEQKINDWRQKEIEKLESWKSEEEQKLRSQISQEYKENYKLINKKDIVQLKSFKPSFKWLYWLILLVVLAVVGSLLWYFRDHLMIYKKYSIIALTALLLIIIIHLIFSSRKRKYNLKLISERSKQTINICFREGLVQLIFSLKNPVENLKLRVLKTRKHVHVIPAKHVYQYFKVEANIDEGLFEKTNYNFKVSKTWLSNRQINKEDVKLVRFFDGRWINISSEFISEDNDFVYYLSNTNFIGQFAIIGKDKQNKGETSRSWTGYIVIVLLLVVSIGLISYFATLKQQDHLKGIPDQTWEKDTTLQINLSTYFSDKDNDNLTFILDEKPQNIQVDIFNEVAILTPQLGWTGNEYIRFKVIDEKGAETTSNRVRLEVKRSFVPKLIKKYSLQIAGTLIIIAIISLIVLFRKQIIRFLEED